MARPDPNFTDSEWTQETSAAVARLAGAAERLIALDPDHPVFDELRPATEEMAREFGVILPWEE